MVRTFNSQSGFNAHIDNFSGLMIINENCYERNSIEKLKGNYDDSKAFKSQDKIIKGLIDLKNENKLFLFFCSILTTPFEKLKLTLLFLL